MALTSALAAAAFQRTYQRVWDLAAVNTDNTGDYPVITHGLGATPTEWWVVDLDATAAAPDTTTWSVAVATVTATQVTVRRTVTDIAKGSTAARLFLRTEHTIQSGRNAM